jgi:two-component system response regulator GlrR
LIEDDARFGIAVAQITSALREHPEADELIDRVLGVVLEHTGSTGCALVEERGGTQVLRGGCGAPIELLHADVLRGVTCTGSELYLVDSTPVLRCSAGSRASVYVQPWNAGSEPGPVLDLACAVLERVIGLEERAGFAKGEQRGSVNLQTQEPSHERLIAASPALRELIQQLDRLASAGIPVLIQGESGAGKELLAKRVHRNSGRADGPFLAINCSTLPGELLEAELFGIKSGVATGVTARPGKFMLASGGTLFLDEIGDLPDRLQPKLLRALESGEVCPVGAPTPVSVDVRIISATNRDLGGCVSRGDFRKDLYYRLAGAVVTVSPLRERPEDILPLAKYFSRNAITGERRGFKGFGLEAAELLLRHDWPGNARELRNVVERALALSNGPVLHAELLPGELRRKTVTSVREGYAGLYDTWKSAHNRFAHAYFSELLRRARYNLSKASRLAGVSRSNLYRYLDDLGVRRTRCSPTDPEDPQTKDS